MEFDDELYVKVDARQWRDLIAGIEAQCSTENGWRRLAKEKSFGRWTFLLCDRGSYVKAMLYLESFDEETIRVSRTTTLSRRLHGVQHRGVLRGFHDDVLTKVVVPFPVLVWWQDNSAGKIVAS